MLFLFAFSSVLTILLIYLIIKNASLLGMVAIPNERSVHKKTTPSGAGLAFISAMFISVAINNWSAYNSDLWIFTAIFLVFMLGVYDDYQHSLPKLKFIGILLAAIIVYINGLAIDTLGSYFGYDEPLPVWVSFPITLIAITGFTNALNLIDGLDGLAGTISLIIIGSLAYLGYVNKDGFVIMVSGAVLPALLVFMLFNWNPAKIFMGDSGSLTIGFIIAILSIKALAYIDPVSILFIAAIPILDTVTVMVRRKRHGLSILSADKNHLHHIMLDVFKGNVKKTVLFIASLQLLLSLFGIFLASKLGQEVTLPLFFICLIGLYIVIERLCYKNNRPLFAPSESRSDKIHVSNLSRS